MSENINELMQKTADALNKNNMQAFIVSTKEEALNKVKELMEKGESVSMGGSMTLKECGIADLLAGGNYEFLDRSKAKTEEEKLEIIAAIDALFDQIAVLKTEKEEDAEAPDEGEGTPETCCEAPAEEQVTEEAPTTEEAPAAE